MATVDGKTRLRRCEYQRSGRRLPKDAPPRRRYCDLNYVAGAHRSHRPPPLRSGPARPIRGSRPEARLPYDAETRSWHPHVTWAAAKQAAAEAAKLARHVLPGTCSTPAWRRCATDPRTSVGEIGPGPGAGHAVQAAQCGVAPASSAIPVGTPKTSPSVTAKRSPPIGPRRLGRMTG
jgi:hypothetical protein